MRSGLRSSGRRALRAGRAAPASSSSSPESQGRVVRGPLLRRAGAQRGQLPFEQVRRAAHLRGVGAGLRRRVDEQRRVGGRRALGQDVHLAHGVHLVPEELHAVGRHRLHGVDVRCRRAPRTGRGPRPPPPARSPPQPSGASGPRGPPRPPAAASGSPPGTPQPASAAAAAPRWARKRPAPCPGGGPPAPRCCRWISSRLSASARKSAVSLAGKCAAATPQRVRSSAVRMAAWSLGATISVRRRG